MRLIRRRHHPTTPHMGNKGISSQTIRTRRRVEHHLTMQDPHKAGRRRLRTRHRSPPLRRRGSRIGQRRGQLGNPPVVATGVTRTTRSPKVVGVEPGATLDQRDDVIHFLSGTGAPRPTHHAPAIPGQDHRADLHPVVIVRTAHDHPHRSPVLWTTCGQLQHLRVDNFCHNGDPVDIPVDN